MIKARSLLVAVLVVLSAGLLNLGNGARAADTGGYPYANAVCSVTGQVSGACSNSTWTINGQRLDPWGYEYRNCTSYMAWRLSRNGYTMPSGAGHANNWDNFFRARGIVPNNTPAVGAIAQTDAGSLGHVAYVEAVGNGTVTISEYNVPFPYGTYHTRTVSAGSFVYIHVHDLGRMMLIRSDSVSFGNDSLTNPTWTRLNTTTSGIAVGGKRMLLKRSDGVLFGNDSLTNPTWTQITTNPRAFAVGSTGLMVLINSSGVAVANNSLTNPNWTVLNNSAAAIAVGGNNVLLKRSDGVLFGNSNPLANPTWTRIATNPRAFAISPIGRAMLITSDGVAWGNDAPFTNPTWTRLSDSAKAVAVGGKRMLLKRSDGVLFGNDSLTNPTWTQITTNPRAFDVGDSGRMILINSSGAAVANDSLTNPNWTVLNNSTSAVAVG